MPRRKGPCLDNKTARDILHELSLYATDKQFYPVKYALYTYMAKPYYDLKTHRHEPPRYPDLGLWTFDWWFDRLVEEGYIEVDPVTKAIRCLHLEIIEKEEPGLP